MFSDAYLDKEENGKLLEVVLRWLTTDEISLNPIDAEDPEVGLCACACACACMHACMHACACACVCVGNMMSSNELIDAEDLEVGGGGVGPDGNLQKKKKSLLIFAVGPDVMLLIYFFSSDFSFFFSLLVHKQAPHL